MYEYSIGIRFQAVAGQHSQRPAIWWGPRDFVTYRALDELSNRCARMLIAYGVGKRDVVCLSGEKSVGTFACMLGCLKIGAVYCVLDPENPPERVRRIVSTCSPKLLLSEGDRTGALRQAADVLGARVADKGPGLVEATAELDGAALPQTRGVTGNDPAYIMFTSGSTGVPKGAVMNHANVLNLIAWIGDAFSVVPSDILTNVNPLYFDNSVFDFYGALFTGACLVPFSKAEVTDPKTLVTRVDAAGCTVWFSVPSLLMFLQAMKAADGHRLKSIRTFVFGGEGYPKSKLKRLYDDYSESSAFYNVYGPTECTCICACHEVTAEDFADLQGLPPLGQVIENFAYLILDPEGRPAPPGVAGELCLLGPNVGAGYYADAKQTAARFVPNPQCDVFPEVMYRTGDIVRLDPTDQQLYILGRTDNQIKHMGYRIELEEIEAALHSLDYVSEAAALHSKADGLSRIVAVVAGRDLERERLQVDLGRIVPDYMIPSVFHFKDQLPKNANGKVDRQLLARGYTQPKPSAG